MSNKGSELNKRVWSLFEKAGFHTTPNSSDPSEEVVDLSSGKRRKLDLVATVPHLHVKIIGENTTKSDLKRSFTTDVHDFEKLISTTNACAALFVFTRKELTQADIEYAKARNIAVWNEDQLRYSEKVVDAIGQYAKYEIINSLGVKTEEEKETYTALAIKFSQPYRDSGTNLFLFTIPPEKLLKSCVIHRKVQGSADAYQRMLSKKRLGSIRRFVSGSDCLLPPNIIVHLGETVAWESLPIPNKDTSGNGFELARGGDYQLVVLRIPMAYASLELIDGQHRLYGFVGTEPEIRENFNLVVLGIKGLPYEKRRDTFVAINDKARRVDANLVAFLKHTYDEKQCQEDNELMAIRVVVELNRTTPFKNKIKLLDFGDQKITLKGFSGYDLKGLLGPRGLLRKHYRSNQSSEYIGALRTYFGVLRSLFPKQWEDPDKYIIFTNRGVSAFLKLLKSILKTTRAPIDEKSVRKYLLVLQENRKDKHWETKGLKSSYIGAKGWRDFHRDLIKTIRSKYRNFKE